MIPLSARPSSRSDPPSLLPSPGTGGFLHPERIAQYFNLRPGMIVADFGAGGGYFTIPVARLVTGEGKVYAIDIQKSALNHIKTKASLEHLLQIEPVWADLELTQGSRLHEKSVDMVIVANILFQADKKKGVLGEAWRVLKPGGRMAILEWNATPFPAGPPPSARVPKDSARRLAEETGFELEKEFEAGDHHYGLLVKKK